MRHLLNSHGLLVLAVSAATGLVTSAGGCGRSDPAGPPPAEAHAMAVETPPPVAAPAPAAVEAPPSPEEVEDIELALLEGFTKAIEARDIDRVASWLAPELAAELRRFHAQDPNEFWARGALWTSRAASGLELVARQGSDGVDRWRGLVRFGDGFEESVAFGRFDGRVLLADL